MAQNISNNFLSVIEANQSEILNDWIGGLRKPGTLSAGSINEGELKSQCSEFLALLHEAASSGNVAAINGPEWSPLREMLASLSRSRAKQGFTPTEVANFVLSLKSPIFRQIKAVDANDCDLLYEKLTSLSTILDILALWTTEVFQKSREELIIRQQEDMLEISTPVVKLWDGILALPIIGTLDSARTQVVMENLLQAIVDTGSEVAIIDITGVPTVDTLVSQHLLKTVAAAQLMGADCIISGIRPQIAQTIVHLGVDLTGVVTKTTLEDAFKLALKKTGATIVK